MGTQASRDVDAAANAVGPAALQDEQMSVRAWRTGVPFTLLHDEGFVVEKFQELLVTSNAQQSNKAVGEAQTTVSGLDEASMDEIQHATDMARIKLFARTKRDSGTGGQCSSRPASPSSLGPGAASMLTSSTVTENPPSALAGMAGNTLSRESPESVDSERLRSQRDKLLQIYYEQIAARMRQKHIEDGEETTRTRGLQGAEGSLSLNIPSGSVVMPPPPDVQITRKRHEISQHVTATSVFTVGSLRMQLEMLREFRVLSPKLFESGTMTLVQTLLDSPPFALQDFVEELLTQSYESATTKPLLVQGYPFTAWVKVFMQRMQSYRIDYALGTFEDSAFVKELAIKTLPDADVKVYRAWYGELDVLNTEAVLHFCNLLEQKRSKSVTNSNVTLSRDLTEQLLTLSGISLEKIADSKRLMVVFACGDNLDSVGAQVLAEGDQFVEVEERASDSYLSSLLFCDDSLYLSVMYPEIDVSGMLIDESYQRCRRLLRISPQGLGFLEYFPLGKDCPRAHDKKCELPLYAYATEGKLIYEIDMGSSEIVVNVITPKSLSGGRKVLEVTRHFVLNEKTVLCREFLLCLTKIRSVIMDNEDKLDLLEFSSEQPDRKDIASGANVPSGGPVPLQADERSHVQVASVALDLYTTSIRIFHSDVTKQFTHVLRYLQSWQQAKTTRMELKILARLLAHLCTRADVIYHSMVASEDSLEQFLKLVEFAVGMQQRKLRQAFGDSRDMSNDAVTAPALRDSSESPFELISLVNAITQASFVSLCAVGDDTCSRQALGVALVVLEAVRDACSSICSDLADQVKHTDCQSLWTELESIVKDSFVGILTPVVLSSGMMLLRNRKSIEDLLMTNETSEKAESRSEQTSRGLNGSATNAISATSLRLFDFLKGNASKMLELMVNLDVLVSMIDPKKREHVMENVSMAVKSETMESSHEYENNLDTLTELQVPGATRMVITFDPRSRSEVNYDYLTFYKDKSPGEYYDSQFYSGRDSEQNWPGVGDNPPLIIESDHCFVYFHTDGSNTDWGYKFTATAEILERKKSLQQHWIVFLLESVVHLLDESIKILVDGSVFAPIDDMEVQNEQYLQSDLLRSGVCNEDNMNAEVLRLLQDFVDLPASSDAERVIQALQERSGDEVRRGPNWSGTDESGEDGETEIGTVISIPTPTKVHVRWNSSGLTSQCDFDPKHGKFDVVLVDEGVGGTIFLKGNKNMIKDSAAAKPWSHFGLFLTDSRMLVYKIACGSDKESVFETDCELDADQWSHVAIVQDEDTLRVYVNGLMVSLHILESFLVMNANVNPAESAIIESTHPLEDSIDEYCPVHIPGAVKIRLTFDPLCDIDGSTGFVRFYKDAKCVEYWGEEKYTGKYSDPERNFPGAQSNRARLQHADASNVDLNVLEIPSDRFLVYFHNEGSSNSWGFRILASPELATSEEESTSPVTHLNPYPFYFGEAPGRVLDEPAAKCWIYQPKVLSYPISESDLTSEIQTSFPLTDIASNVAPAERTLYILGLFRTCAETSFGRSLIGTPGNLRNILLLSFDNLVPVEIRIGAIKVLKDLVGILSTDDMDTQVATALPGETDGFLPFVFQRLGRALNVWRAFEDDKVTLAREIEEEDADGDQLELRTSAQGEASLVAAYVSLLRGAAEHSCWGDQVFELVISGLQSVQTLRDKWSESKVEQILASLALLGGNYGGAYIGGRVSCCVNVDGKEMIETGYLVQFRIKSGNQTARVIFDCDQSNIVDVPLTDVAHLDDIEKKELASFLKGVTPFASGLKDLYQGVLDLTDASPSVDSYQPKLTKKENVEVLESEHPYAPGEDVTYSLNFRGATEIEIRFDKLSCTAGPNDYIQFKKKEEDLNEGGGNVEKYWGEEKYYGESFPGVGTTPPLRIPAGSVDVHFYTEGSSSAGIKIYQERNRDSNVLAELKVGAEFVAVVDLDGWLKVTSDNIDQLNKATCGWVWQRTGDTVHASPSTAHSVLEMDERNDEEQLLTGLCSAYAFDEFKGQTDRIQSLAYDSHRAVATKAARDAIFTFLSCDPKRASIPLSAFGNAEDIFLLLSHFFIGADADTAFDNHSGVLLALRKRLQQMVRSGDDDAIISAVLVRCLEILKSGPQLMPKGRGAVREEGKVSRTDIKNPDTVVQLLSMTGWMLEALTSIPDASFCASPATLKLLYSAETLQTLMFCLNESPQSIKTCALEILSNMAQSAAFHTIPAVLVEHLRDLLNVKMRAKHQAEERVELKSPYLQTLFAKLASAMTIGLSIGEPEITMGVSAGFVVWEDNGKLSFGARSKASDGPALNEIRGYKSRIREGDTVIILLDLPRQMLVIRKNGIVAALVAGPPGSGALVPWDELYPTLQPESDIRLVVSHSCFDNRIELSSLSCSSIALIPQSRVPNWYGKVVDAVSMMLDFRENLSSTVISRESRHPLASSAPSKPVRELVDINGAVALEIRFDKRTKLQKRDELRFFAGNEVEASSEDAGNPVVVLSGINGEQDVTESPHLFASDCMNQSNYSLSIGDLVTEELGMLALCKK
ncbi:hypothetical protein PInf_012271 [Phytophthora infestans]|nr:hypothetical protein PInf_012271 [Phytophthora infestans]